MTYSQARRMREFQQRKGLAAAQRLNPVQAFVLVCLVVLAPAIVADHISAQIMLHQAKAGVTSHEGAPLL